jgi:hypothetical protein
MQLKVSKENPDLPKHKCLALGIFADERPPRGICGFIDWRLNGMVSREIRNGRISGAFEEKIVIPFPGRIGAEMLLLIGLGYVHGITYDKIYNAAYLVTKAVDGMGLKSFAFDLYGEGRLNLITANIAEAMITGLFDFLSSDIEKLSVMEARIITSPASVPDVSAGVKQFKTNVNDKDSVDVSSMENSFTLN